VCLATSTLLLVSAGVFMASTGHTMQRAGLEARRSAAREAAFAGMTWAAHDAAARSRTEGAGTLELAAGVTVAVRYAPAAAGSTDLAVEITVSPRGGDQPLVMGGTLVAREGAYTLGQFR
jgi:hypothetical protein